MSVGSGPWTVAIALKGLAEGKSRLSQDLSRRERAELVVAMASDVVDAARSSAACGRILIVTPEPELAWRFGSDVVVLPEQRASGLNDAYARAIRAAGHRPLALVAADLPGLRPVDLELVAEAAEDIEGPVVVADCEGSGSTVLASTVARRLDPRFGSDSLRAHTATGATDVSPSCAPSLRHDIDTLASLASLSYGDPVGPATGRWLAGMRERLATASAPCTHGRILERAGTAAR